MPEKSKGGRPPKIGERAVLKALTDRKPRFLWEIADAVGCNRKYIEYYLWRRRYHCNQPSLLEKKLVEAEVVAEFSTQKDEKRLLRRFKITKKGLNYLERDGR